MQPVSPEEISEVIRLGATNNDFFCKQHFPKTARQAMPNFHKRVWQICESPESRLINLRFPRGFGKTSLLRMLTAKRIAYGISRLILYVGKSEPHALRSVHWLRQHIMFNTSFTSIFGLTKGEKFQDSEAQIMHRALDQPIWLLGVGIEGSLRGINLDDFRPDLIILDDVIGDGNAATPDGRQKLEELIFGAVMESLAPASDTPDAKLIFLNTPIDKEDPSAKAMSDPSFTSFEIGCWTEETKDLDLSERQSIWEERFPSEILRTEKRAAIGRGLVHIFNREKECRITDPDTNPLKTGWLKTWDICPPRKLFSDVILVGDPVPKPTELQVKKNLHGKDWEVWQVWGRLKGQYYLLDYLRNRGHEPNWSVNSFFELAIRWSIRQAAIDAVAYQSTLAWLIKQEMRVRGRYWVIDEENRDNRSKYDKIIDALSGPGSEGAIYVPVHYTEFRDQWTNYPNVSHDDDLDCAHMAIKTFRKTQVYEGEYAVIDDESDIPDLKLLRAAP